MTTFVMQVKTELLTAHLDERFASTAAKVSGIQKLLQQPHNQHLLQYIHTYIHT